MNTDLSTPLRYALVSRLLIILTATLYAPLMELYRPFYEALGSYDAGWYYRIATAGYDQFVNEKWAFFPLFPYLTKFLPMNFYLSSFIINNLLFLASSVVLYRYVQTTMNKEAASIAVILFAFSPYSFYLSAPYTESLFIFLSLLLFYLATKERWLSVAFLAPFISLTRNIGVFMVFPLGLIALKQYGLKAIFTFRIRTLRAWLAILLLPCGLFLYMLYMYHQTGDALAFVHIQSEWHRLSVLEGFQRIIPNLIHPVDLKERYHGFFFLVGLSFALLMALKKFYAEAVWIFIICMLGAITGTFTSMARFVMAGTFPVFMAMALIIQKSTLLRQNTALIYSIMAMLLGFFTTIWLSGGRLA